jgi:hypothetical protein
VTGVQTCALPIYLSTVSQLQLETGFSFKAGSELLADFTYIKILSGMVILYRDCSQS